MPLTPTVINAARQGHGYATMSILIAAGNSETQRYVPVPVLAEAASGNVIVSAQLRRHVVLVSAFPKMSRTSISAQALMHPFDNVTCNWSSYGSQWEGVTHIGEVHVGNISGMKEEFKYSNNADSTVSVGFSTTSPTGGYAFDGNVSITNSIGTNSGFTVGQGTSRFVDSHMYYQRYEDNGAAACPHGGVTAYKTQAVQNAGDSWYDTGTNQPVRNPYGGCAGKDPYGYATVAKGGYFNSDRGTAEQMFSAATWYGFGFETQSGFSSDLFDQYDNNTSGNQQVCGAGSMPDVPILYNNTW